MAYDDDIFLLCFHIDIISYRPERPYNITDIIDDFSFSGWMFHFYMFMATAAARWPWHRFLQCDAQIDTFHFIYKIRMICIYRRNYAQ